MWPTGISSPTLYQEVTGEKKEKEGKGAPSTPTPPPQRRLAKSFSVAPAAVAVSKGTKPKSLLIFMLCTILKLETIDYQDWPRPC